MKRDPSLRSYSEDHHHGLVAARRLGQAAERGAEIDTAVTAYLDAWRSHILPHFRDEEDLLLPALAAVSGDDDPVIARTQREHVALRRLARELEVAEGEPRRAAALAAAALLHDHIRFEEAELFPAIEARVSRAALDGLARAPGR